VVIDEHQDMISVIIDGLTPYFPKLIFSTLIKSTFEFKPGQNTFSKLIHINWLKGFLKVEYDNYYIWNRFE
jgi:hypothetical protein